MRILHTKQLRYRPSDFLLQFQLLLLQKETTNKRYLKHTEHLRKCKDEKKTTTIFRGGAGVSGEIYRSNPKPLVSNLSSIPDTHPRLLNGRWSRDLIMYNYFWSINNG